MNALVSTQSSTLATTGRISTPGFSMAKIRDEVKAANPGFSAKQVRLAVRDRIEGEQKFAVANFNEAIRRSYKVTKVTESKKGNLYFTVAPPPKSAAAKAPAIESLPLEALQAEIARRAAAAALPAA